jgi:hypothetical protein
METSSRREHHATHWEEGLPSAIQDAHAFVQHRLARSDDARGVAATRLRFLLPAGAQQALGMLQRRLEDRVTQPLEITRVGEA